MTPRLPLILLMGPTASGKSQLALALARRLPVELISVDSAQVYRGMDIGTAKPSAEEQAAVPHHLLDLLDPAESYSAARFREDALRLIADIRKRKCLPLLVGGTMLYFRALQYGLSALPSADPELRAQIEAEAAREGWPAMHARLAQVDPDTAARLAPNDRQRIQRALEIHALSGVPASVLHATQPAVADQLPGPWIKLALVPQQRADLHRRIEMRLHDMMRQGFLEEVRRLQKRGDLHENLPSIRSVGYRQLWQYLEGHGSLDEAVNRAVFATRQFAKRQLTRLRSETEVIRLEPASPTLERDAMDHLHPVLDSAGAV